MKKQLNMTLAAALVVSAVGLTSANVHAAPHSQASTKPPTLKKGVTLSVWNYFGDAPEVNAQKKVLAAFTKSTGIKIGSVANPTNSASKFQLAAPTGNAPDIIGVPHDQVAALQAAKVLYPIPAWAWPSSEKSKYLSAAVKATTISGKSYAMPWSIQTTGLFYNKKLTSAAIFKPAKGDKFLRWSTLIPRLQKLTDIPNKKYGFVMDMDNFYYEYAFLSGYGGYVFKYQKGKGYNYKLLGLNTPAGVKAVQFFADLSATGKYKLVPTSFTTGTADALFQAGLAAVEWTGPWNEGNMTARNINYGFEALPSFNGKKPNRPFSTVQVYAVNRFSKHLNEAIALVKYLTQNMQMPFFKASGQIPVLKADLHSKTVQSSALSKQLAKAALAADPIPNIPQMAQVWTPAATDWLQAAEGKASAAAAAAQAQKDAAAAIAKANSGG